MSKNIGIYFNDLGFSEIDFTILEKGNPGIGGTHFEVALLFFYLSKQYNVTVFHHHKNILPESCKDIIVDSFEEAVVLSKKLDVFICQANIVNAASIINKNKVKTIVWSHNFLHVKTLNEFAKSKYVVNIVCVGKKLYYLTHIRTPKAVLIYNMVSPILFSPESNRGSVITYIGSLVPAKGFHVLADVWQDILKSVPDAQLYIIGSGTLYNRNAMLGKYGIAQKEYEELIIKKLSGGSDSIPSSVHFMGNLGEEKNKIISQTLIGIVNPTGRTETFGISALDFNCGGVVAIGNMPSIVNGKNGFKICSKRSLKKRIIYCLKNKQKIINMGKESREWVKNHYFPEIIMKDWHELIESI